MRTATAFLLATLTVASAAGDDRVSRLEDILTKPQIAYLARRVPQIISEPGPVYGFTFKEVPGYKEVTVYYLMEMRREKNQRVRRLKSSPSAVGYTLYTSGYTFPVLDELLSDAQKATLAEQVKRANVRGGSVAVVMADVKDLGRVTLYYLAREGKLLAHPSMMVSTVRLSAKDVREDPLLLRKYLAPEGVTYLTRQIRDGERVGRHLRSVALTRLHFDVVTKTEPDAKTTYEAFKKDVRKYSHDDMPLRPEAWPAKFVRPDGLFDVERTLVQVQWTKIE